MSIEELGQQLLEAVGADRDGWEGDDCSLTCPDGCRIEMDCPQCPCGHTNPIMAEGLI